MREIQESGIKNLFHTVKPYIFTGSWMEGVNSVSELFEIVKDTNPCESLIKCFNILCPYEKTIPKYEENTVVVSNFFGAEWYRSGAGYFNQLSKQ
jgi:hypothetical protein